MKKHLDEKAMERYTEMLIEQLNQMEQSNWEKPWISLQSFVMPQNIDGREYTMSNVLMLLFDQQMRGFQFPVYLTMNQANDLGLGIQKGSKSFPVSFWNRIYWDEDGARLTEKEYDNLTSEQQKTCKTTFYQKFYNVFNIDQTDIKTSHPEMWQSLLDRLQPQHPKLDDSKMKTCVLLDQMLQEQSWVCPIHLEEGDRAFYSMGTDSITVPLKRQFIDGESFYGTLLHEMVHSIGAPDRLDRLEPAVFGSEKYGREELVAELGSALAAISLGINKTIKDESKQYIKSWLETMRKDPKFLLSVISDVAKAVNELHKNLPEVQQLVAEAEQPDEDLEESQAVQASDEGRHPFYVPVWMPEQAPNGTFYSLWLMDDEITHGDSVWTYRDLPLLNVDEAQRMADLQQVKLQFSDDFYSVAEIQAHWDKHLAPWVGCGDEMRALMNPKVQQPVYYASVAYLQSADDTSELDELYTQQEYRALLNLARDYDPREAIDLTQTRSSATQHGGDVVVDEDEYYAVVYNASVGGTFEVFRKVSMQEVEDMIIRYGLPEQATEEVCLVATKMETSLLPAADSDREVEEGLLEQLYEGQVTLHDAALQLHRSGRFESVPSVCAVDEYLQRYRTERVEKGDSLPDVPYAINSSLLAQVKQADLYMSYRDLAENLPKTDRRIGMEFAEVAISSKDLYEIRTRLLEMGEDALFSKVSFLWNEKEHYFSHLRSYNEVIEDLTQYVADGRKTARELDKETIHLDGETYQIRVSNISDSTRYSISKIKDNNSIEPLIDIESAVVLRRKDVVPLTIAKERIARLVAECLDYHPWLAFSAIPDGVTLSDERQRQMQDEDFLHATLLPILCRNINRSNISYVTASAVLEQQHYFDHKPQMAELAPLLDPYLKDSLKIGNLFDLAERSAFGKVEEYVRMAACGKQPSESFAMLLKPLTEEELFQAEGKVQLAFGQEQHPSPVFDALLSDISSEQQYRADKLHPEQAEQRAYETTMCDFKRNIEDDPERMRNFDFESYIHLHERECQEAEDRQEPGLAACQRGVLQAAREIRALLHSREQITIDFAEFDNVKRQHPDTLMFFRSGDYCELYQQDAEVAARILGTALTHRMTNGAGDAPKWVQMTGFPFSQLDRNLTKMVRAGYRVAICDSIDDLTILSEPLENVSLDWLEQGRAEMLQSLPDDGRLFKIYCKTQQEKNYHALNADTFVKADLHRMASMLSKQAIIGRIPFLRCLSQEGTAIQVRDEKGQIHYQTKALARDQPLSFGEDRPIFMAYDLVSYNGIRIAELGDRTWTGLITQDRKISVSPGKEFTADNLEKIEEMATHGNLVFNRSKLADENEYMALEALGEPTKMKVHPSTLRVDYYHVEMVDGERYAVNRCKVFAKGAEVDRLMDVTPERVADVRNQQEERVRKAELALRQAAVVDAPGMLARCEIEYSNAVRVYEGDQYDFCQTQSRIGQIVEEERKLQADPSRQVRLEFLPDELGIQVMNGVSEKVLAHITPNRQVRYADNLNPEVQVQIEEMAKYGNLLYQQPKAEVHEQTIICLALNPLNKPSKIHESPSSTFRYQCSVETVDGQVYAVKDREVLVSGDEVDQLMDLTPDNLAVLEEKANQRVLQAEQAVRTCYQQQDSLGLLKAAATLELALQYKHQEHHAPQDTQLRIEQIISNINFLKTQSMETNDNEKKELKDGISVYKMQNGLYGINEVKDGVRSATRRLSEEDVKAYFDGLKGQPKEEVDRRRAALAEKYLHLPVTQQVETTPKKQLDPISEEVKSRLSHASVFKMQDGSSYAVRTQIDGMQFSAKRVKREDIAAFFDGYKGMPKDLQDERKAQLAAMYFSEELNAPKLDVSQTMHR